MDTLINGIGLLKKYNGREVVRNIDIEIKQGEILALIGTNGAGKTTTISMLTGIIKPDSGNVYYWREDYKSHIGIQLQSTPFFEGFTALENMMIFAALHKTNLDKQSAQKKLKRWGLEQVENTLANRLSIGQQKALAIAVATVHQPELVVFDEPTSGLDPRARYKIRELIKQLSDENCTVLFSSHDMEEVSKTATRIIIMDRGGILANGSPQGLIKKHKVKDLEELYLSLTITKGGEKE